MCGRLETIKGVGVRQVETHISARAELARALSHITQALDYKHLPQYKHILYISIGFGKWPSSRSIPWYISKE